MDKEEIEKAHAIVHKAMEEAGFVDIFYVGVTLDGTSGGVFRAGQDRFADNSNGERFERLLGLVEAAKIKMVISMFQPRNEI